ncbi:MAG: RNA polymerase sigma factor [Parcubacteria group bacterium]|jgi:RNA polymerase sigma-70 factor (ECF subfamily)
MVNEKKGLKIRSRAINLAKVKKMSDSELIILLKCKNPIVHNELVNRYQKKLFIYLYRFIGNKEETEDLLQNVFLKVYKYCENFDTERKFSSWIYRIAHNEAVNCIKRKSIKKFISLEDFVSSKDRIETKSDAKSPMEVWISKELRNEMKDALKKLPEKYKEVLEMRYFQEKSYEEISKALKKPVNTIGTLINRAKGKLESVVGLSREKREKNKRK